MKLPVDKDQLLLLQKGWKKGFLTVDDVISKLRLAPKSENKRNSREIQG